MVVEQLALESAKPVVGSDHVFLREEKIQRGDTVAALLNRLAFRRAKPSPDQRPDPNALTSNWFRQVVVAKPRQAAIWSPCTFPPNGGESAWSVERVGER